MSQPQQMVERGTFQEGGNEGETFGEEQKARAGVTFLFLQVDWILVTRQRPDHTVFCPSLLIR